MRVLNPVFGAALTAIGVVGLGAGYTMTVTAYALCAL